MEDKLIVGFVAFMVVVCLLVFCLVGYALYELTFYDAISGTKYKFEYDSREYKDCHISEKIIENEIIFLFSCQIFNK